MTHWYKTRVCPRLYKDQLYQQQRDATHTRYDTKITILTTYMYSQVSHKMPESKCCPTTI